MKVLIIRHGKVDHQWPMRCTSFEFDKACEVYDKAPVADHAYKDPGNGYRRIYISRLGRSKETAKKIFGSREFTASGLLGEVPLRSSFDTELSLPLWFWNITGRLQWFAGSSRQTEGRTKTRKRARAFVKKIIEEDEDAAVVTHGFYLHTLLSEMKKAGFSMDKKQFHYKNGAFIECRR